MPLPKLQRLSARSNALPIERECVAAAIRWRRRSAELVTVRPDAEPATPALPPAPMVAPLDRLRAAEAQLAAAEVAVLLHPARPDLARAVQAATAEVLEIRRRMRE